MEDPPSQSTDSRAVPSSDTEKLNACLRDMFAGPTRGIESAFAILLDMMERQAAEHRELKAEHEAMKTQHGEEIQRLLDSAEAYEEKQKMIMAKYAELSSAHDGVVRDMGEMGGSIRVLAYNFGFEDDESLHPKSLAELNRESTVASRIRSGDGINNKPQEICLVEGKEEDELALSEASDCTPNAACDVRDADSQNNNVEVEEKDEEYVRKGDNCVADGGEEEEVVEEEEKEKCTLTDSSSTQVSVAESADVDSAHCDSATDAEDQSPSLQPRNLTRRPQNFNRRQSVNVAKEKLAMSQTLVVRLERLEEARFDLQRELEEVKSLNKLLEDRISAEQEKARPAGPNEESNDVDRAELSSVKKRIGVVEDFLCGFGAIEEESSSGHDAEDKDVPDADGSSEDVKLGIEQSEGNANAEADTGDSDASAEEKAAEASDEGDVVGLETASGIVKDEEDNRRKATRLSIVMSSQEARITSTINELTRRLDSVMNQMSERVSRQSMQGHLSDLQATMSSAPTSGEELDVAELTHNINDLRNTIVKLGNSLEEKVSSVYLDAKLEELKNYKILEEEDASVTADEGEGDGTSTSQSAGDGDCSELDQLKQQMRKIEKALQGLQINKVDRSDLSRDLKETGQKLSNDFEDRISKHGIDMNESMRQLQDGVNGCREFITLLEAKLHDRDGINEEAAKSEIDDLDLDARIKQAADAVESSLQQSIAARLEGVKAMEVEIEKLTSRLADKPDQDQINGMLHDLEEAFAQKLGSDETLQPILENMRLELRKKLTRAEVLTMVKHLLDQAKLGIANDSDTLMVGRTPYRCIGCNSTFPNGVHNRLAPKINHNALPSSRGLRISASERPGALRPLQLIRSRERPKTAGAIRLSSVRSSSVGARNRSR